MIPNADVERLIGVLTRRVAGHTRVQATTAFLFSRIGLAYIEDTPLSGQDWTDLNHAFSVCPDLRAELDGYRAFAQSIKLSEYQA